MTQELMGSSKVLQNHLEYRKTPNYISNMIHCRRSEVCDGSGQKEYWNIKAYLVRTEMQEMQY